MFRPSHLNDSSRRIFYLTQYYVTDAEAGGTRPYHHIKFLAQWGYHVDVITSYVSYNDRTIPAQFQGTKIVAEQKGHLRIYRTYAYPHYGQDMRSRLRNYLSFAYYAVKLGVTLERPDVVLASSPSLFVGLAGWILSVVRRTKFVLEIRDLWPEAIVAMKAMSHPVLIGFAKQVAALLYRQAHAIIALSDGIRQGIRRYGIAEGKIHLIPNAADVELYENLCPDEFTRVRCALNLENKFVAMYAGALAHSDGLEIIINAAALLREWPDIHFVFVGNGARKDTLRQMCREKQVERQVTFVSQQPKKLVPNYIGAADVCLLPIAPGEFWSLLLPNKIFDYLAVGRPVIAAVPPGDSQKLLQAAGAGIVVPSGDHEQLAAAITGLYEHSALRIQMGERGRQYILTHFPRHKMAQKLRRVLDKVSTGS